MIFEDTVKTMANALKNANAKETTPYDSVATVTRVENGTAWVHIAGGVDETPVKMTVDCKEGDEIQVRVGGGRAWIVGNATSPPTDDTLAIEAKKTAENANQSAETALDTAGTAKDIAEATNQHFWTDDNGVHVSSESRNATATRNTLWNSLGMLFRKGSNILLAIVTGSSPCVEIYDGQGNNASNVVARFASTVTVGKTNDYHINVGDSGINFHSSDGEYGYITQNHFDDDMWSTETYDGLQMGNGSLDGARIRVGSIPLGDEKNGRIELNADYWKEDPTFHDWGLTQRSFVVDSAGLHYDIDDGNYRTPFSVSPTGLVTASGGIKFSLQDVTSASITLGSGATTWQTLNAPSGSSYAVYAGYYINGSTNILPYCVRQTDTGVQFALHNMVNSNQTFKVEARFLVWG